MGRRNFGRMPIAALLMYVFVIAFGMFWTIMARSIGAPIWFFGILFVAIGVASMVSVMRGSRRRTNAPAQVSSGPVQGQDFYGDGRMSGAEYCPYCGARAGLDFEYCKKCGRKIA